MSKKWTPETITVLKSMYEHATYKEIAKVLSDEFGHKYTPNGVRKAYARYKYDIVKVEEYKMPKILIFDIETMPMEFYAWSLRQKYLSLDMMKKDWSVLSWAAKWMDGDEVFYDDTQLQRNIYDDKRILKRLWKLVDEADIVVGHNSNNFDIKKINARFAIHGMKPPRSYKKMDTYLLTKKHFGFTSHKLSYLTKTLCKDKVKSDHNEFPGFSQWRECINSNERAWKSMKEYNILDVTSLEELFKIILPWENAALFSIYNNESSLVCSCGSTDFKKNGYYYTNACKYQVYTCKSCGAECRDKKNLLSKEKKQSLKKGTVR